MNTQSANDLRDFFRFVGEKVDRGQTSLSPEQIVDEWRGLHPQPLDADEINAIQEALDDMEHGDTGIPLEEFDREFRIQRALPPRQ